MKSLHIPKGSKLFLDTAPLIYWIEGYPSYVPVLEPVMTSITQGHNEAISSYITLIEVLVKPFQHQRHDLASRYKEVLLNANHLQLIGINPPVCEMAAHLKAKHKLKTPDAIQLAIAKTQEADVFLTNDHELKRIREIRVVTLDSYG